MSDENLAALVNGLADDTHAFDAAFGMPSRICLATLAGSKAGLGFDEN